MTFTNMGDKTHSITMFFSRDHAWLIELSSGLKCPPSYSSLILFLFVYIVEKKCLRWCEGPTLFFKETVRGSFNNNIIIQHPSSISETL